jgi:hypothetical protein
MSQFIENTSIDLWSFADDMTRIVKDKDIMNIYLIIRCLLCGKSVGLKLEYACLLFIIYGQRDPLFFQNEMNLNLNNKDIKKIRFNFYLWRLWSNNNNLPCQFLMNNTDHRKQHSLFLIIYDHFEELYSIFVPCSIFLFLVNMVNIIRNLKEIMDWGCIDALFRDVNFSTKDWKTWKEKLCFLLPKKSILVNFDFIEMGFNNLKKYYNSFIHPNLIFMLRIKFGEIIAIRENILFKANYNKKIKKLKIKLALRKMNLKRGQELKKMEDLKNIEDLKRDQDLKKIEELKRAQDLKRNEIQKHRVCKKMQTISFNCKLF